MNAIVSHLKGLRRSRRSALAGHGASEFSNVNTLDPSRVEEAWDTLSRDTWGEEVAELPSTLHAALIDTLMQRHRNHD